MNTSYTRNGERVQKTVTTDSDTTHVYPSVSDYRVLSVVAEDRELANDGADIETLTISVVDGLEVAQGTDPADAPVLDYTGDVVLAVDGAEVTRTADAGTATLDVTTEKSAGATIEVEAVGLDGVPAESDAAVLEVISG